ncbi:uncharacterized protein LOC124444908 [Xenia sp. Carnegie-2017]|uniref:uncharacterized protein LOC124444908 n=1 Tax=Xenia sp. Carnegie-2017 TaxID=2897299 RepID=UPI001F03EF67|nr:uncharacterized protein LOC124444908 [Xenia sp. Carnegie-2017]XP_046851552.1 uncharacterized protein LOC124444908 [Xenia sp. Carnegie-2017]
MAVNDLSLVKDWIYILCIPIQTILAIITLVFVRFWWEKSKIRKQEREKEMLREEDRQRADAEKIAENLGDRFFDVESKFHKLKKSLDILRMRERTIVNDLKEFHVLVYMCRKENWGKFHHESIGEATESDPRDDLLSDVKEIIKFILDLRIKLYSTLKNQACPDDIKSEFSNKINEMGDYVYNFVPKHQQDIIEKVKNYFDPAQTEIGIEMQSTTGESSHSPTANQPPKICPDNAAIENAIPYLKYFKYPKYGQEMTLEFTNSHSDILNPTRLIEEGLIKENDEVLREINKLWKVIGDEPPGGGLLHSIRMINYKLCTDKNILNHQDFLEKYERPVANFRMFIEDIIDNDMPTSENAKLCKNMLRDVGSISIELLKRQYLSLRNKSKTVDVLENITLELQKLIFEISEGHS